LVGGWIEVGRFVQVESPLDAVEPFFHTVKPVRVLQAAGFNVSRTEFQGLYISCHPVDCMADITQMLKDKGVFFGGHGFNLTDTRRGDNRKPVGLSF
jgi:hypothetical protein